VAARNGHLVHGRWIDPHPVGSGLGRRRHSSSPGAQASGLDPDQSGAVARMRQICRSGCAVGAADSCVRPMMQERVTRRRKYVDVERTVKNTSNGTKRRDDFESPDRHSATPICAEQRADAKTF